MMKYYLFIFLSVVCLTVSIRLVFPTYRVYGTSDEPSVHNGQIVVAVRYWFREPARGDLITFTQTIDGRQMTLLKRVIGLPGDVIIIQGATIIEDNVQLQEPYVAYPGNPNGNQYLEFIVPNDEFFMLGDNRADSEDSRNFGFVSRSAIIARVVLLLGKGNTELVPNVSYVFAGIHAGGIWQLNQTESSTLSADTTWLLTSPSVLIFWIIPFTQKRQRMACAKRYRKRSVASLLMSKQTERIRAK